MSLSLALSFVCKADASLVCFILCYTNFHKSIASALAWRNATGHFFSTSNRVHAPRVRHAASSLSYVSDDAVGARMPNPTVVFLSSSPCSLLARLPSSLHPRCCCHCCYGWYHCRRRRRRGCVLFPCILWRCGDGSSTEEWTDAISIVRDRRRGTSRRMGRNRTRMRSPGNHLESRAVQCADELETKDVEQVVQALQKRFREYARLPPTTFRDAVSRALADVPAEEEANVKRTRIQDSLLDVYGTPATRRIKRTRAATASGQAKSPRNVTYADFGGVEDVLASIAELIECPLAHPEVYEWLGVAPPRGVLLHGPPGCGKTALAHAIANECGVPFFKVAATEIVSGMSGESEAKLRRLFQDAANAAPSILFLDEIDAIVPKRETAQREMERRIVAQLLTCMDDLANDGHTEEEKSTDVGEQVAQEIGDEDPEKPAKKAAKRPRHVVVIGATNRPDSLDPALRRAGRFDRELALGIPNELARCSILKVLSSSLRLEGDFDFHALAKRTPGYVGADLAALTKEAAALAVKRVFDSLSQAPHGTEEGDRMQMDGPGCSPAIEDANGSTPAQHPGTKSTISARLFQEGKTVRPPLGPSELEGLAITMHDFEAALKRVQPSLQREGFATVPDVTWADVGALSEVREELRFSVTEPIKHPDKYEAMGLRAACGVLLYGPPGCGKTLVAKAAANESGANFISIKGPELLNKYVGESERAVRQLFARARAAAPCVLFFDEMDAMAPRRGGDSANASAERIVNQLLTDMDGLDPRTGVYVIAATNRPDIIDPALLRPGRLDRLLYVPLPNPSGRQSILQTATLKLPLEEGVLGYMMQVMASSRCSGYSGADVVAFVREAAVAALKEACGFSAGAAPKVGQRHIEAALAHVQPSVSRSDARRYEELRLQLRRSRGHIINDSEETPASNPGTGTHNQ